MSNFPKQDGVSTAAMDPARTIRQVSILGLVVNLFLSGLKITAGFLAASQAVVADGFHSLSDCITDIIVIVGVKYWSMPPDENHPYGHQRIETIISVVVGLALAVTAIALGYDAALSLTSPRREVPGILALVAAVFSIIFKEALFQYTVRIGKKIRSTALEANAWHHRSDAFSSIPVAIAVVAVWLFPRFYFFDSIAAILVSLFILHTAWKIVRPNLGQLTDEAAEAQIIAQIETISRDVPGVEDVHAIRTRNAGSDVFVDLHVLVKQHLTIHEGHEIAAKVKHTLLDANNSIKDVLVHIEPH